MEAELVMVSLEIDEAAHCLSMGQDDEAVDHLAKAATLLETLSPKQANTHTADPLHNRIIAA